MSKTVPKQRTLGLFPTPILMIEEVLAVEEIKAARDYIYTHAAHPNSSSPFLLHTEMFSKNLPSSFQSIEALVLPQIDLYSGILLGQQLRWRISGMWGNLAHENGVQPRHNHANSIISGIVYLTSEDEAGTTRFHKPHCDLGFSFENHNADVAQNVFNATTWFMKSVRPGDVVLFPSYLTHEVPKVLGEDRLTVAFNAVPHELNSSGYVVRFEQDT